MAESVSLTTEPRETLGTRLSRRLRQAGRLPAVIYGHKEQTLSVSVARDEFEKALRNGIRLFDLAANGTTQQAVLREVQWDHLGKELLHVDFQRVSKDERIKVNVAIELKGTAPGATGGGILDWQLHTLTVECPAADVPKSIRVNIDKLLLGQAVHVKELTLPAGVKALVDDDVIVVQVTAAALDVETAVPTAAEPELIGRKVEDKGEEAE